MMKFNLNRVYAIAKKEFFHIIHDPLEPVNSYSVATFAVTYVWLCTQYRGERY